MKTKLKIEKRVLNLSFAGSVIFMIVEGAMAWMSHSRSILTDCVFDAADLVMVGPFLVLIPLLYKPVTEKHPYGYSQVESLFLLIKYVVLLSITGNLIYHNVIDIVHGGHTVDAENIAVFELLVCAGCVVIYLTLLYCSKRYASMTIQAELYLWKLDIIGSMGVAIAFFAQILLQKTTFRWVAPYVDPLVAIVMALALLVEPVREIIASMKNLVLFAPNQEIFEHIRGIVDTHVQDYPYEVKFLDVIQTGRKIWVEVYITNEKDEIHISILHQVRDEIRKDLRKEYDQVYIEVIPD